MDLHFDSWQTVIGVIFGLAALISAVAALHWKLFIAPQIKTVLAPYGERLDVVTEVVRRKFPQEYADAQRNVQDERPLRTAI